MCVYSPKLQRAVTSVAVASSPSHPYCFRCSRSHDEYPVFRFVCLYTSRAGEQVDALAPGLSQVLRRDNRPRVLSCMLDGSACRILCDNQLGSDYQDENEPACDLEESSCCHLHHCHLNRMHA